MRATRRIATEKQRKKTGRRFAVPNRKIATIYQLSKKTIQPSAEAQTAIAQSRQTAIAQTGADIGSDQDTIPPLGGELDKNPRDPSASNPGDQAKKRTTRKARLVSYSSQEGNEDETVSTSSRRSGRKRTAVTKMGGVMIDFTNKNEKEGKKCSEKK